MSSVSVTCLCLHSCSWVWLERRTLSRTKMGACGVSCAELLASNICCMLWPKWFECSFGISSPCTCLSASPALISRPVGRNTLYVSFMKSVGCFCCVLFLVDCSVVSWNCYSRKLGKIRFIQALLGHAGVGRYSYGKLVINWSLMIRPWLKLLFIYYTFFFYLYITKEKLDVFCTRSTHLVKLRKL